MLLFGLSGGGHGAALCAQAVQLHGGERRVFNLGIVIAAPLLARHIGVYALPVGVVVGSLMQLGVMFPGLRGLRLRPSAWRGDHPAVRRILRLYLPIALGLIVTQVANHRGSAGGPRPPASRA